MTLPGDPNLPPGVSTRDTDGPQGSGVTCPKCGSDNVSELNDPDLLCCDCDHDWVRGKEDESNEPDNDPGPLPLEHVAEYDAVAQWCAERGLDGSCDPLPGFWSTGGALCWIQADREAFMERVKQCAYALAMAKVKGQS